MEQKRLGDIATYINGYAFKPEDRGTEGLPIIRIQDLTGNSYDVGFYNGEYPKKVEISLSNLKKSSCCSTLFGPNWCPI